MNTHVVNAMRVLAPHDLRLIWRDGFLLSFIMFAIPVFCLVLPKLVPFATAMRTAAGPLRLPARVCNM